MNLRTFHDQNVDALIESLLDNKGKTHVPYILFSSPQDAEENTIAITFPDQGTDEFTRLDQYELMTQFVSSISIGHLSLISYMRVDIPASPHIPEVFWDGTHTIALVGTVNDDHLAQNTYGETYSTSLVLFGVFDGEFIHHRIDEISEWQEFINNVTLFRDLLFTASMPSVFTYRWLDLYRVAVSRGFQFDFFNDQVKALFSLSQQAYTM